MKMLHYQGETPQSLFLCSLRMMTPPYCILEAGLDCINLGMLFKQTELMTVRGI